MSKSKQMKNSFLEKLIKTGDYFLNSIFLFKTINI